MQTKPLHIISFDNPFPPVYGGVIDVYYKICALHSAGFEIYLHCFVDQLSEPSAELRLVTKEVHLYKRRKNAGGILSRFPFAIKTRFDELLVENLRRIDAPIFFEGLQTTYLLRKNSFDDRKIFLRLHNLEANYFAGQSRSESNPLKKAAYFSEFLKYSAYQKVIKKFRCVFTLSIFETEYVNEHYGNAVYVPVFHGNSDPEKLSQFGKYAFYHGDLRLPDNKRAVDFLIRIFRNIPDYQLVIASGTNAEYVTRQISDVAHISHVHLNDHKHLKSLLQDAHINVMLSFQESGTKLKLINALFNGRFCLINKNMVDDESLRSVCIMAETERDFITEIKRLRNVPYDDHDRKTEILKLILDDTSNAQKLLQAIES